MPITLGAQYYRPPFPGPDYWENDLKSMRDAGLNAVQLWLVWGWIEAVPGTFAWDDYDRLVELAGKHGLGVVLSTIAAVHPYWIHREVPDSEMITNMGQKVVSTNRREIHFGITPGGCIDHPGVRDRMARFLVAAAERYSDVDHLVGWDAWNELRWNVHADGLVCYCPHTITGFHTWLEERYGGLPELNAAWDRRYQAWDEVLPGKRPGRVYTEMMAFQEYISHRSVEHARWRYRLLKERNPGVPVTVHGGKPTVLYGSDSYHGQEPSTALHRGNDWEFADVIDGVGTSSFPLWEDIDLSDFICRIDFVQSAARGKRLWLSELQGGRSADGFNPQHAVPAADQQRWVWSGLAAGADTVLFWCWRDEVFGRESGGFGIIGQDGHATERVEALTHTGALLARYDELLSSYRPRPAEVGIWFSPRTYYHNWCEDGDARRPMRAIQGVARALLRNSIPYTLVEEQHLDELEGLKVLIMPRSLVIDDEQAEALHRYVERGGTIVVESEAGAFGSNGIYRHAGDRFLFQIAGIEEAGRRPLPADVLPVGLTLDGELQSYFLPLTQWITPYTGGSLMADVSVGRGRVVALGVYTAEAYYAHSREEELSPSAGGFSDPGGPSAAGSIGEYERFLVDLLSTAGVTAPAWVLETGPDEPLGYARVGEAGGSPLLFIISEEPARAQTVMLEDPALQEVARDGLADLVSGQYMLSIDEGASVVLPPSEWGVHVLVSADFYESEGGE